jgi:hypothetical protein
VQPRRLPLRLPVALRPRAALLRRTPGHHPLVPGEPLRGRAAVPGAGKVVSVGCGGRGLLHTPVDADSPSGSRQGLGLGSHDEGGVPRPGRIPVHAHAGGWLRQFPRPHRPHHGPACQVQTAVPEPEPAPGVVQARTALTLLLETRQPGPLPHRQPVLDVLQRLGAGPAEIANDLLLRDARARSEPRCHLACPGQHPVVLRRTTRQLLTARLRDPVHLPGLGHRLIPDPPAAVPLGFKPAPGSLRQPHTEGVPGMPGHLRGRFWRHASEPTRRD